MRFVRSLGVASGRVDGYGDVPSKLSSRVKSHVCEMKALEDRLVISLIRISGS